MGLEPGTTVDHYVVRQFIDAGGMGEVYVAFDPRLERQVAIKALPEGLARDPEFQRRFRREAQAGWMGSLRFASAAVLVLVVLAQERLGSPS